MACRSVATALTAVVAIVSTIALQGCGDDAVKKEPGTAYFFQNIGTGACRIADGVGKGDYTCHPTTVTMVECRDLCLAGPSCVGFETNMDRTDPDVPANINCTCELHTTAVTKVEPKDHPKAECYSVEKMITETATYV